MTRESERGNRSGVRVSHGIANSTRGKSAILQARFEKAARDALNDRKCRKSPNSVGQVFPTVCRDELRCLMRIDFPSQFSSFILAPFLSPFLPTLSFFRSLLTYVLFELLELLPALVVLLLADPPDPLLAVATRGRQSITACNGNERVRNMWRKGKEG